MKYWFSLTLILLTITAEAESCLRYLSFSQIAEKQEAESNTSTFISYISNLIADRVIDINYVKTVLQQLDSNKPLINPFDSLYTKSQQVIHRPIFQYYLDQGHLDQSSLKIWAQDFLKKHKIVDQEKKQAQDETQTAKIKVKFEKIKTKKFTVKVKDLEQDPRAVELDFTYDFEVMNVPVTQQMWWEIMGGLPKHLRPEGFFPDYPITRISWWAALKFANEYSKLHGLPEVYDMSKINFVRNDLPGGDFAPNNIDDPKLYIPEARKMIINAPEGNIYAAKGFRLPTEAEQLFLLTNGGQSSGDYFGNLTADNMTEYACFNHQGKDHSSIYIHAVAEKSALNLNGALLYDLYGLVFEYSSDWHSLYLENGKDISEPLPKFSQAKPNPMINARGGGAISSNIEFKIRNCLLPIGLSDVVGFRLVRSLPK